MALFISFALSAGCVQATLGLSELKYSIGDQRFPDSLPSTNQVYHIVNDAASEERDRKWAHYRLVTGDFYIVVPNKKVQAQVVTEITTWAYQSRTRLTLHVCNLSLLKEGGLCGTLSGRWVCLERS